MFLRRASLDRDAVAAAQRRLAAITAGPTPAPPAQTDVVGEAQGDPHASDVVAREGAAQPPAARPPLGSGGSSGGRHAARERARTFGRWGLTPHHVTIVALIALGLFAVTAWWVLRSVPEPQPVQFASERTLPSGTPAEPALGGVPVGAGPTTGEPVEPGATPGLVVVDVAGKVRRPGIVELPAGSRVVDALSAAGGARRGVKTTSLNLARPLVDGEQIVVGLKVPVLGPAPSAVPSSGTTEVAGPISLNTATQEQLETLPGVGPVTATAILDWRTEHGGFTSVDELLEVSGIGEVTLSEIAPHVVV